MGVGGGGGMGGGRGMGRGMGGGRRMGMGGGRGMGRGTGMGAGIPGDARSEAPRLSKEEELALLRQQADAMSQGLKDITDRIQRLVEESSES